ncbi:MAG: ATPase, T2SS/T4P/T4SS family, partial [Thermodesulfobacteriota bacterium]|nr:ATPase, T2SS/T4P/T4SS family [Thermodesulfobacteriota bacterium]
MENNDIVRKEIVPKNQEPDYTMSFPVSANDTLPPDEKVKILSELLNFTKEVSSKKDLNNLLTYIVPRITSMLNSERSSVFIVDYENKKIYTRFAEGKGIKEIRLPLHTGVVGHTIDNNEIINIKDAYKDDRFCIDVDRKTGFITKNILSIPLTSHEDRVIGALQVLNKKDGIFTKADEDLLATISSHIGISIDNVLKISDFEKLVTPPNKVKKYRISSECLGEILLKNKMISWEDYRDTLNEVKETGERLGRLLIDRRVLLQRDVLSALAGQLDIDFIEQDEEISKNNVSKLLTPDESQKYKAIPISRDKKKVKMAMIDPTDVMAIDDLEFITQSTVVPCLVSKDYFDKKYFISYGEQKRVEISEKEVEIDNKKDYETHQITSWPIIKIVNYYLYRAMETRSSDIHFEPTEKYFIIRNRIDGVMHEMVSLPKNIHPEVTSRVKILCDMNIAERRVPQDGRFSFKFDVRSIDVRVSTFPTVHGEKIVMRLLEKGALKQDLHALGMDSYSLNLFKEKIATPHGMILLSGPTGSGKTTTL